MKISKFLKTFLKFIIYIISAAAIITAGINLYMVFSQSSRIVSEGDALSLKNKAKFDCICVLGCSAKNGKPSKMLKERLDTAVSLYNSGVCDTLLFTGDHTGYYNEIKVMKSYAVENGVAESDILTDEEGFSTVESMQHLVREFNIKRCIVVTQKYHLYRALYIADAYGIDAYGVDCTTETYWGQLYRNAREIAARMKDFCEVTFSGNL